MNSTPSRKPISNFFIKKQLQVRLIQKIVIAVLLATFVCVSTLTLSYLIKYKSAVFYKVNFKQGSTFIGDRESITKILYPSLIISSAVNVLIGICIGFYASRKYAIPIYKFEKWIHHMELGHFNTKLQFREKTEMKDLSDHCNRLSEKLCAIFTECSKQVDILSAFKDKPSDPGFMHAIDALRNQFSDLQYLNTPISIHTGIIRAKNRENMIE